MSFMFSFVMGGNGIVIDAGSRVGFIMGGNGIVIDTGSRVGFIMGGNGIDFISSGKT